MESSGDTPNFLNFVYVVILRMGLVSFTSHAQSVTVTVITVEKSGRVCESWKGQCQYSVVKVTEMETVET